MRCLCRFSPPLSLSLSRYSGDFWVDLECKDEYAFCCDAATFVKESGTASKDSFLNDLAAHAASKPVAPAPVDPDPYADRRLCFSTKQTWADSQSLCKSVGSNLITIHTPEELEHAGKTVQVRGGRIDTGRALEEY